MTSVQRNWILIIILPLLIIVSLFFYVQKIFIPVLLKKTIITKAAEFIDRPVKIKKIDFSLLKGIYLSNIVISEKDPSQPPLAIIDEISLNFALPVLGKNPGLIIPSLKITNPRLNIVRLSKEDFNFSDITASIKKRPARDKSPFSVIITSIALTDGALTYTDITHNFQETINHINVRTNLSLSKLVQFNIQANVAQSAKPFIFHGKYSIDTRELDAQFKIPALDLANYFPLFYADDRWLIKNGTIHETDLSLRCRGSNTELRGDLNIDGLNAAANDTTIIGDSFVYHNAVLQSRENTLTLTGDLSFTKANIHLSAGQRIEGDGKYSSVLLRKDQEGLTLKGELALNNGNIVLSPARTISGAVTAKGSVTIKPDDIAGQISLTGQEIKAIIDDKKFSGDLSSTGLTFKVLGKNVELNTPFNFKIIQLDLAKDRIAKGNAAGQLSLTYDPSRETALTYQGNADIDQGEMTGLPKVGTAQNIKGGITFETDKAQTKGLTFTAMNSPMNVDGNIQNLADPALDVSYQADKVDLSAVRSFFSDLPQNEQFTLNGFASLKGRFKGKLSAPLDADIQVNSKIKDASITSSFISKPITGISGDITASPGKLICQNIRGNFDDAALTLNGTLTDFKRPSVDLTLSSDDFNFTSQFTLRDKKADISSLHGYYLNSSFDVHGNIALEATSAADLKGNFNINAADIPSLPISGIKQNLKKINPKGILTLDAQLTGPLKDWTRWQLLVSGQSESLSMYGLEAKKINVSYDQRNKFINEGKVTGDFYDGQFIITSSGDLNKNDQPFFANLDVNGVNIEKLKNDTQLKNKRLDGTAKGSLSINGSLKDMADFNGQGFLSLSNGHLWQSNLFKGLWESLLVPEFLDVVFTDAQTDFQIKNKRVALPDLNIRSSQVELNGRGWIDFNGKMNLDISPMFSEIAFMESAPGFKKVPTSVLTQNSDIVTIKVTGSLQNPKYVPITDPSKVIKKTTGAIWQGVQDIFQGIF